MTRHDESRTHHVHTANPHFERHARDSASASNGGENYRNLLAPEAGKHETPRRPRRWMTTYGILAFVSAQSSPLIYVIALDSGNRAWILELDSDTHEITRQVDISKREPIAAFSAMLSDDEKTLYFGELSGGPDPSNLYAYDLEGTHITHKQTLLLKGHAGMQWYQRSRHSEDIYAATQNPYPAAILRVGTEPMHVVSHGLKTTRAYRLASNPHAMLTYVTGFEPAPSYLNFAVRVFDGDSPASIAHLKLDDVGDAVPEPSHDGKDLLLFTSSRILKVDARDLKMLQQAPFLPAIEPPVSFSPFQPCVTLPTGRLVLIATTEIWNDAKYSLIHMVDVGTLRIVGTLTAGADAALSIGNRGKTLCIYSYFFVNGEFRNEIDFYDIEELGLNNR